MTIGRPAAAVVVAGGVGSRAGPGGPKQWRTLAGRPVARWSLQALADAGCAPIVLVARAEDHVVAAEAAVGLPVVLAEAGSERADSVRAGLAALVEAAPERVLIHDAARPFLSAKIISDVLAALDEADAAAPALPVSDTLKRADAALLVQGTEPRDGLFRVQTPQGFRWSALRDGYARLTGDAPTDDLAVVERTGGRVQLIPGDSMLTKLTHPEDFAMAERLAAARWTTRVGLGVDAHRFGPGDGVWLCGVKIPSELALIGHSDADAGLHALTDAVLGALSEGDIGDHFPPSDPQWRGAASDQFLAHAVAMVAARGGRLANVDVTIVSETPRIKPHRQAMRERLAAITGLPLDAVSVKATTTERMGFTGREEGLLAQAVATVELPSL